MFAFEQADIRPDLVTLAKSLAGGLPLGRGGPGRSHGRTRARWARRDSYGGNALACAAALAVLDAFEQDGFLDREDDWEEALARGLRGLQQRYPGAIGEVRGLGFMRAMEMVELTVRRTRRWGSA